MGQLSGRSYLRTWQLTCDGKLWRILDALRAAKAASRGPEAPSGGLIGALGFSGSGGLPLESSATRFAASMSNMVPSSWPETTCATCHIDKASYEIAHS